MSPDHERDIIIVSDLHLSAGYDVRLGAFDRNEDFFYDAAFGRFLDHLRRRADAEGRRWRLVLLGDVFDFLQVDLQRDGRLHDPLDRSEAVTIAKLERIARGHPRFFAALGRFAAAGFPIVVLPGNHDIELVRPATQSRFAALVAEAVGKPEVAAAFTFHPWIYYVPGMLYAEHGHQYDAANSFITQLEPYVTPGQPDRIDLPLGSYFVEYLFNRIEAIDPFADNVKPATAYFTWAFKAHPFKALATLGAHAGLFLQVLRHTDDLTPEELAERRRRYRATTLPDHAPTTGLSARALEAIDQLAAVPAMTSKWRQLQALVFRPMVQGAPALGLAIVATVALLQLERSRRPLGLLGAGVLGAVWRRRRGRPGEALVRPGGYLRAAAERIDAILRAEGCAAPCYVFGHTHAPQQFPLDDADQPARYLMVQADGQNVKPVTVDEFQISVAETFDVIVEPRDDRAFTLVAEAVDRSGMGRATLAPRAGMSAEIPPLRARPRATMRDMGMDMSSMTMAWPGSTPEAGAMDHGSMDHGDMSMRDGANAPQVTMGPGVQSISPMPVDRMGERGQGLEDVDHRVLVYTDLEALEANPDLRMPTRSLELHLTGNMERFMWSFDGERFSEVTEPIPFRRDERVRVTLVNDSMMAHPIHLHGHFFELLTGPDGRRPRKHTVNVLPGGKATFDLTADAPGDWAFHCHMLYHMHAGMFRVVSVRPLDETRS